MWFNFFFKKICKRYHIFVEPLSSVKLFIFAPKLFFFFVKWKVHWIFWENVLLTTENWQVTILIIWFCLKFKRTLKYNFSITNFERFVEFQEALFYFIFFSKLIYFQKIYHKQSEYIMSCKTQKTGIKDHKKLYEIPKQ